MKLTILKVYTQPVKTVHGDKIKVGLITEEYGKDIWVNSLMRECDLKNGDIIEADIKKTEKYGYEFTYKHKLEKPPKTHSKADDIRLMNAINNATALASAYVISQGEIEDCIKWLYHIDPDK